MDDTLSARARAILRRRPVEAPYLTYQQLAAQLGLAPPGTIQQLARVLEQMMHEDVARGRPMLAALVVSRTGQMPRRGFFDLAVTLGRFPADPAQHLAAWQAECAAVQAELAARRADGPKGEGGDGGQP